MNTPANTLLLSIKLISQAKTHVLTIEGTLAPAISMRKIPLLLHPFSTFYFALKNEHLL